MANFSETGAAVQEETALALAKALPGQALKRLVARETGRAYDSIRDMCTVGRANATLDVLLNSLDVTPDPDAVLDLLRSEKYVMAPAWPGDSATTDDLKNLALRIGAALGVGMETLTDALDPDSPGGTLIWGPEEAAIQHALEEVKRRIALFEAALEKNTNWRQQRQALTARPFGTERHGRGLE